MRHGPLLGAAAALAALGAVVYGRSLSGGFLDWDDQSYVAANPEVRLPLGDAVARSFTTFHNANWNPLHRIANAVQWQASGGDARVFRVVSLALHVLNAALAYVLLSDWLGRRLPAFAGAALFLLHPANVENVAWISEQKTLLATALATGAAILYLRGGRGLRWGTGAALALFVLALLAKTSVVVLPALLVLLDLATGRPRSLARWALFVVPAAAAAYVQVRAAASADAVGSFHGGSALTHAATVLAVVPRYVATVVLPSGLSAYHTFPAVRDASDVRWLAGLALVAAGVWVVVRSWRGERRWCVALPWFAATLAPMLVVAIPILYAERYLYPSMPLAFGAGASAALGRGETPRRIGAVVLGAVALWWGAATFLYAPSWRTPTSLWANVCAVDPDESKGWGMLAWARTDAGDHEGAALAFRRYLTMVPGDRVARADLALADLRCGRHDDAIAGLEALVRDAPGMAAAWSRLARFHELLGNPASAERALRRGIAALPSDPGLAVELGEHLLRRERPADALAAFEAALRLRPGDETLRARVEALRAAHR